MRKILIMGLPGAGKTTLATALAPLLNAVVFNADAVRSNISRDLGFSHQDRIEHARRMGWLCDRVVEAGGTVIADFICPTEETRAAFGEAFTIWLDRISTSRFEDTNRMFVPPKRFDIRVSAEGSPQYWAEQAVARLRPAFDPQKPTALFLGRYQPFHPGHQQLIEEGLRRVGQVCIAVRDTHGLDEKNLTHCQICGSSDLELVFDCGSQPLCDSLLRPEDLNRPETYYPLRLFRCTVCANCQLDYIVSGSEIYYPEYPYRGGITREVSDHLHAMASDLVSKVGLSPGARVIDIGSNDGTLLSQFKKLGMKELGIEPTNINQFARQAGIETLQAFFTEAVARDVRQSYGAAKLMTATNVFAHMATLGEVMRGITALLDDDGVFVFENHYLLDVIERNQYDTIYHEHVRTYCLKPIVKLFSYYDMEVFRVERVTRYGGSIRVFTARNGRRPIDPSVGELLRTEQEFGLYDGSVYAAFRKRVEKTRDDLISLAFKAKSAGASFVGKSCPGRCSTLLNYCDIGPYFIPYIAEQHTSLKLGMYVPGKHIPVVKDERLAKDQPDYIVIFAWHYGKPIAQILRHQMGLKSKLVVPLPNVTIWDGEIPA